MKKMNRISWLCAALAGLVLFSCTQRELELPVNTYTLPAEVLVSIEEPDSPATKTHIEGTKVFWDDQDEFAVGLMSTNYGRYKYNSTTGKGELIETVGDPTNFNLDHGVAAYPYSAVKKINDDGSFKMTLPAHQTYVAGTFDPAAAFMVSAFAPDAEKICFKNAFGILVVKLYGSGVSVSELGLMTVNSTILNGDITLGMEIGGEPVITYPSGGGNDITMDCSSPVALGSSASNSTEFFFMVPPGSYQIGLWVDTADGGSFSKMCSSLVKIERNHITRMAALEVVPEAGPATEPEAVDLGLPSGTLWASMNLGATAPEEAGDFFAFAELEPKENYGYANWQYFDKDNYLILKYNLWEDWGDPDFRAILDPADDAAHVILGSDWRTPTMEELTELRTECEITNVTLNGVSVRKFTGPTGNCIYIPNAGYMSGTHRTYENNRPILASSSVVISQDNMMYRSAMMPTGEIDLEYGAGVTIRPVKRALVPPQSVDITVASSIMIEGTTTATATVSPDNVTDARVLWESSNPTVATVNIATGKISGLHAGTAKIWVYTSDGQFSKSASVSVLQYEASDAIDLGLPSGTKWASQNLGTPKQTNGEYLPGAYYAWGELNPKYSYDWSNYAWGFDEDNLYKYNAEDGLLELDTDRDDAARYHLGDTWRTPTADDWVELIDNCTIEDVPQPTGSEYKPAIKLTSKINGNSIILPKAGSKNGTRITDRYVYAMSSSKYSGDNHYLFKCFYKRQSSTVNVTGIARYRGVPIRPVKNDYVAVTGVSITPTSSISLNLGDVEQLKAEVSPSNATYKSVTWSSSDASIAKVDGDGWVAALSPGEVTITATSVDNTSIKATKKITVTIKAPIAVDLGLTSGLKWADFNLGASHKTGPGAFYAWGDTKSSTIYGWDYYIWGTSNDLTKYNATDNLVELQPEDDAATQALGNGWRMPTYAEMQELATECTWEFTTLNDGISSYGGARITGPNGNEIFIPAAGYILADKSQPTYPGDYLVLWSATRHATSAHAAIVLTFQAYENTLQFNGAYRCWGASIRPVHD